ncbi:hypothetical protein E9530_002987 [Escherichia coli]|nr:hypothetical protein [Escherichia coli]
MNINSDKIVQLADTDTIENLTSALSQRLIADQLRLTTAESCLKIIILDEHTEKANHLYI